MIQPALIGWTGEMNGTTLIAFLAGIWRPTSNRVVGFFGSRWWANLLRPTQAGTYRFSPFSPPGKPVQKTEMNANPGKTVDTSGIDISNHARLRAMTRLGVVEAAEHIRGLLSEAKPVEVEYVKNAQAWQVGNITIVTDTDGEVVQTLFEKQVSQ